MSKAEAATGMNPSITVGPAPDHPPPATQYGERWVMRTYQAQKTSTNSATGGVTFSTQDFQIASSAGIAAFFYQQNVTDLGGDTVVARDYGTATSLAGMTFKIPIGHAKALLVGTTSIVDCNPAYGTELATYCCQIHCWVSI